MIMDTLGALALATEPPNDEMMRRPPVKRGHGFITLVMWRNILGQALYQLLVLGTLMFVGKRILNIEGPNADRTINTLIFNSFVFCQVWVAQYTFLIPNASICVALTLIYLVVSSKINA